MTASVRLLTTKGRVSVDDTALCDFEGRPVFEWTVTTEDGRSWNASDLKGPAFGPEPSETEMLRSLFTFMSAAFESQDYRERSGSEGENEDLFPSELLTALEEDESEVSMLGLDPEDGEDYLADLVEVED